MQSDFTKIYGYPFRGFESMGLEIDVQGKKVFSTYKTHFTRINLDDVPKAAISTPFGLFEFNFVTFGPRNAAQKCVFSCINYIFVAFATLSQHRQDLYLVFQRLRENLSPEGMRPSPEKVPIIRDSWKRIDVQGLKRFIGTMNSYKM